MIRRSEIHPLSKTLLDLQINTGKTTNFRYKISNTVLNTQQVDEINNTNDKQEKIQKRLEKIKDLGGVLDFVCPERQIFENNLILIDSALPVILAESLKIFYSTNLSKVQELTKEIERQNPLDFNLENKHPFYQYKIKKLLTDIALGMMPSKVWTGKLDTTGGYLIVKENGDVLCYHIYNQNEFENYLFNNTKFDTASSSRHDFGKVFKEGKINYIRLNLQIRFL